MSNFFGALWLLIDHAAARKLKGKLLYGYHVADIRCLSANGNWCGDGGTPQNRRPLDSAWRSERIWQRLDEISWSAIRLTLHLA